MRSATVTNKRCSWAGLDGPMLLQYHDREWGVPVHNDRKHFEVLVLSGAQVQVRFIGGLSNVTHQSEPVGFQSTVRRHQSILCSPYLRSDLKPARSSSVKSFGCSQAAK